MTTGDRVAWVTKQGGKTCGLSAVHRVYDGGKTYCLRTIPESERLFQPLPSLHVCSRCETLCNRAEGHLRRQSA